MRLNDIIISKRKEIRIWDIVRGCEEMQKQMRGMRGCQRRVQKFVYKLGYVKIFQNLLQTNAIYQKENSSVLEIILSIQE